MGECTILHNRWRWHWQSCRLYHIRKIILPPWPPSSFRVSETSRHTTTRGLPATLMILHPSVWARLLYTEPQVDSAKGHFCILNWKTALCLVLQPLREVEDWDKPRRDCCWPCARPVNVAIKASFMKRNRVLKIVKKGVLYSPDFMMLPRRRIKKGWLNMSCIPDPLKTQHNPEYHES